MLITDIRLAHTRITTVFREKTIYSGRELLEAPVTMSTPVCTLVKSLITNASAKITARKAICSIALQAAYGTYNCRARSIL